MLFERIVPFSGIHYQKHWKNPKQLDISEISLNKNLFKPMINFDFGACVCLVWLDGVSLFCLFILFSFCNLVCLGVGYLQASLAFSTYPSIWSSLFPVVWGYVFMEIKLKVESIIHYT